MTDRAPGVDLFKRVKAGAEAIERARALKAELDATLKALIADGPAGRTRALKVLPDLRRRALACLEECSERLLPDPCDDLRRAADDIAQLLADLRPKRKKRSANRSSRSA